MKLERLVEIARTLRAEGVTSVTFGDEGSQVSMSLLPAPPKVAESMTSVSPAEQHRRALLEKHRTMFAASSVSPRFEPPTETTNAVPRAVRAKQDARGRQEKSSA